VNVPLAGWLAAALVALLVLAPAAWALAPESGTSEITEAVTAQGAKQKEQSRQLNDLTEEVNELHTLTTAILSPIAVLVGVLALGGSLGVVFSVRDQRRVSQLHELTVGSEVMSQRRTEQSYASFFDQSQTTLALVNDTLKLAKEATDQAAHSMQQKAEAQIDAIEERAEDLMQRAFKEADFEILIYEPDYRAELHAIGDELRSLEGYLTLQNLQLPRHTRFVKALDQFLLDDTEGALNVLRRASQSDSGGPLHEFTLFRLGYIYTTVGDYEIAVRTFIDDEDGLDNDDTERFQLECIINETRFFDIAKKRRGREASTGVQSFAHEPLERLQAVAHLLDDLTDLALAVETSEDQRDLHHVALEVARTRADVFVWIAYDPNRIDDPLPSPAIDEAKTLEMLPDPAADLATSQDRHGFVAPARVDAEGLPIEGKAVRFSRSKEAAEASPDCIRAWALMQARAICDAQPDPNFDVAFALAECHYMLRDASAERAFSDAERALGNEFGDYLEKRKKVSLRQSELICHSRLLSLRRDDDQQREHETRRVRQSERQAREAVSEMRQARVTVFSQIQRRNITQPEFIEEVERIVEQDHLEE
jgi:hypothetical protein